MSRRENKQEDIAKKLVLYFFIAILIFAMIISAAFAGLFTNEVISQSKEELAQKTQAVARSLSEYISTPKGWESITNFSAYLKVLGDVNTADVWIVDDALKIYTAGTNQLRYNDLPSDANTIVLKAFKGETVISENFTDVLNTPSITVATPIYYKDNYITGVMMMHAPISGMNKVAKSGFKIVLVCIIGAFIISIFPAVYLSKMFTSPIVLKEAEEAVKMEKMRRDYVANISHELKTPVTVLRGSLEALVDGVVTDQSDVKEYHEQMLSETVYLQRLVMDLLDLSRLQNTGFDIQREKVSLPEILDDSIKSAEKLAADKNILITKDYTEPKDAFLGDYGRLRQMFIIILDNAIKFSKENSKINVIFVGREVHIRDFGCGISPERLPHIFERFYKSGGEQNKSGSGLGLAIAREIAHRHGIKISAKSMINEGTEFIFEF